MLVARSGWQQLDCQVKDDQAWLVMLYMFWQVCLVSVLKLGRLHATGQGNKNDAKSLLLLIPLWCCQQKWHIFGQTLLRTKRTMQHKAIKCNASIIKWLCYLSTVCQLSGWDVDVKLKYQCTLTSKPPSKDFLRNLHGEAVYTKSSLNSSKESLKKLRPIKSSRVEEVFTPIKKVSVSLFCISFFAFQLQF